MKKITILQSIYTFQIDFARHVSNIVYIQWMEMARLKLMEEAGLPVREAAEEGFTPVLVSTCIEYRKPLVMGDSATIELWLSELRHASATLKFRFLNQRGELAAQGEQRGLFVDVATGKPYRLSVHDRARFQPYVLTGDTPTAEPA